MTYMSGALRKGHSRCCGHSEVGGPVEALEGRGHLEIHFRDLRTQGEWSRQGDSKEKEEDEVGESSQSSLTE